MTESHDQTAHNYKKRHPRPPQNLLRNPTSLPPLEFVALFFPNLRARIRTLLVSFVSASLLPLALQKPPPPGCRLLLDAGPRPHPRPDQILCTGCLAAVRAHVPSRLVPAHRHGARHPAVLRVPRHGRVLQRPRSTRLEPTRASLQDCAQAPSQRCCEPRSVVLFFLLLFNTLVVGANTQSADIHSLTQAEYHQQFPYFHQDHTQDNYATSSTSAENQGTCFSSAE